MFRSTPEPQAHLWAQTTVQGETCWAIRQQLKVVGRVRDLARFNCGIDAKLRGCDLVKLRVSDLAPGRALRARATLIPQKTGRPAPFEIADATQDAIAAWLKLRGPR